jgi:hypothetical protein
MPLCTALIIAAAASYAAKGNEADDSNSSAQEPDITPAFLQNKSPIDLLPLEQK